MDKVLPVLAGRSSERPATFADVLLCRGRAGDGAEYLATCDGRTIVLMRNVGGLACRIRVGVAQYRAVAVLAHEEGHTIRLLHREAGLSIDLAEFAEMDAAEEYCDRLAEFLDLPALTMAGIAARAKAEASGSRLLGRRDPADGRGPNALERKSAEVIPFLGGRTSGARS
jgi:hypothetical protein